MEQATYKIGEAATLLNLKTYVLRFWETEFSQITPLRTEKGQRLYTESDLALLKRIRYLLHDRGLTIEGARRILFEESSRPLYTSGTVHSSTLSLFDEPLGADSNSLVEGFAKESGEPQKNNANLLEQGKKSLASTYSQNNKSLSHDSPLTQEKDALSGKDCLSATSRQYIINELEEIATMLRGIRQTGKYLQ